MGRGIDTARSECPAPPSRVGAHLGIASVRRSWPFSFWWEGTVVEGAAVDMETGGYGIRM